MKASNSEFSLLCHSLFSGEKIEWRNKGNLIFKAKYSFAQRTNKLNEIENINEKAIQKKRSQKNESILPRLESSNTQYDILICLKSTIHLLSCFIAY